MRGTVIGRDSSILSPWVHHGFLGFNTYDPKPLISTNSWEAGRRGGWKKTLRSLQYSASRFLPTCKCVSCCLQDILKRQC